MRSLMTKMHKGEKGLTLIELLIVVAIIGIIAAVVIPNLGGFMITGRLSAANTELENVKTASLAYYAEYSEWPEDSDELSPDYIAGDLNATYLFCEHFGWVYDVDGDPDWEGITFDAGAEAEGDPPTGGSHGRWIRG